MAGGDSVPFPCCDILWDVKELKFNGALLKWQTTTRDMFDWSAERACENDKVSIQKFAPELSRDFLWSEPECTRLCLQLSGSVSTLPSWQWTRSINTLHGTSIKICRYDRSSNGYVFHPSHAHHRTRMVSCCCRCEFPCSQVIFENIPRLVSSGRFVRACLCLCVLNGWRSLVNLLPDNELALSWSINGSLVDWLAGWFTLAEWITARHCLWNFSVQRTRAEVNERPGGSDQNNLRFSFHQAKIVVTWQIERINWGVSLFLGMRNRLQFHNPQTRISQYMS